MAEPQEGSDAEQLDPFTITAAGRGASSLGSGDPQPGTTASETQNLQGSRTHTANQAAVDETLSAAVKVSDPPSSIQIIYAARTSTVRYLAD